MSDRRRKVWWRQTSSDLSFGSELAHLQWPTSLTLAVSYVSAVKQSGYFRGGVGANLLPISAATDSASEKMSVLVWILFLLRQGPRNGL